jgi:hypothetical protein
MTRLVHIFLVIALLCGCATAPADTTQAYRVDTNWPAPLPNNWILGDVGGVAVDRDNHIWIVHRPATLSPPDISAGANPPTAKCCIAAPPVIEFDADGRALRAWGGPRHTPDWFTSEHGVFVDAESNVWLVGAGVDDGQVLKFTADGELLLRIGRKGAFAAPNDPTMLGRPTDLYVDTDRREVFVSDGYRNHRVIVFDADTGAFKRQWTAFGREVDPAYSGYVTMASKGADAAERFTTVHCVTMIGEELFVCDRTNNRIQVFRPDGVFLRELVFNDAWGGGSGTTWDAAPAPHHPNRVLVVDGNNSEIAMLDTQTGEVIASYLSKGRYAGQMHWPHQLAVDQQGRLYVTEVQTAARVQRFLPNSDAVR